MAVKYGRKVRELMTAEMKDVFSKNKGFVVAGIESVKATDMNVFRKKMRKSGSRYMVVKNRLASLALKDLGIDDGLSETIGEKRILGLGIINDNPVCVARLMMEFSKGNKGFVVLRGYLDGQTLEAKKIEELSNLPGREQLLAMVAGTLNAPITRFAGVLAAIIKSVMYALDAVKEKKEKSDS